MIEIFATLFLSKNGRRFLAMPGLASLWCNGNREIKSNFLNEGLYMFVEYLEETEYVDFSNDEIKKLADSLKNEFYLSIYDLLFIDEFKEEMFNIYYVSPHETQNPDEFITEICYQVK